MYKKYTSDYCKHSYDALVIGSGLGGLTAAALLSQSGKKVLVLERHYVPGGFTHTFKRKDFQWDVGVHYVGQVHNHQTALRKAFDYITNGKLKWAAMDEVYDKAIIADREYDFVSGTEKQIDLLITYFPNEEKAIRSYFEMIKGVSSGTAMFFGEKAMPPFLSKYIGKFLRKKFNSYSDKTTYDALRELNCSDELISVLCAQCGDYGLTPKRSSFAIQAMIASHYMEGGNYPVGGAQEIFKNILDVIHEGGGEVLIRAEVKKIILENKIAIGVEMENGDKIFATKIISNAGARNTFDKLIPDGDVLSAPMKKDLLTVKPSISHLCLYVGLNASDVELKLPKWNYWVYKSSDFDGDFDAHMNDVNKDVPLHYISFPSAKDSSWSAAHPNKSTIQIVIACSYDWVKQWEETNWMKRGAEYEQFKNNFKEKMLNKLYEIVPQTKGHVELCEVSSPLSTRHFSNYSQGEIYGLEHTPARFRLKWLRPQTPIKNLFLTGQDTLTVGVAGALFSGIITASTIMKKNYLGKINKYPSENSVSS